MVYMHLDNNRPIIIIVISIKNVPIEIYMNRSSARLGEK